MYGTNVKLFKVNTINKQNIDFLFNSFGCINLKKSLKQFDELKHDGMLNVA